MQLVFSLLAATASAWVFAAPADWISDTIGEELKKGPVQIVCRQILIDAPGGADHLRFRIVEAGPANQVGDQPVKFYDAQLGAQGSGAGAQVDWRYDFDCARGDSGRYIDKWGVLILGYCRGDLVNKTSGKKEGVWGFFVNQDYDSKVLFAKIFTGQGPASEGGDDRSHLLCRIERPVP